MRKLIISLIIPACIASLTSCMASKTDSIRVAQEQNKKNLPKDLCKDSKFAVCASDGGMMEVKLAELAQSNGSSGTVKQFANTMVTDHTKANIELKTLAEQKKIKLPEKLSDKSQKSYDWLAKKKGEDFDKAYMKCMVRDHKMDVCEFRKEAKKGKDAELKKWADEKVPVLKGHLEMAKAACKESKGKK